MTPTVDVMPIIRLEPHLRSRVYVYKELVWVAARKSGNLQWWWEKGRPLY